MRPSQPLDPQRSIGPTHIVAWLYDKEVDNEVDEKVDKQVDEELYQQVDEKVDDEVDDGGQASMAVRRPPTY